VFSSKMRQTVVIMIARKFQSSDHDLVQKMPCFVRFENVVSRNGCQDDGFCCLYNVLELK
jgi:hypothetical protein